MKIEKVNGAYNHRQFNFDSLNLKNYPIRLMNNHFNQCQFFLNEINLKNCDLLIEQNHFINCHFFIKNCDLVIEQITLKKNFFENCMIHFNHIQFYNHYLSFQNVTGINDFIFVKCIFHCYLNFEDSIINKVVFIKCLFENDVDLRLKACFEIGIQSCKISKLLNLSFFDYSHIHTLNLYDTINLGQILIDWERNDVYKLIINNDHFYQVNFENQIEALAKKNEFYANQFLLLKENYRKQGKYAYEDLAYYEYRNHLERKTIYSKIGKIIGKYGTHPLEILQVMIYVIVSFSFLFTYLENKTLTLDSIVTSFPSYIYFSGITFFTIGYSDFVITNPICRVLALVEAFIGVFLMAYFTGSFIRKVLR